MQAFACMQRSTCLVPSNYVPFAKRIPKENVIVVGIDDNYHSFRALEWALECFFKDPSQSPYKIALVHGKAHPSDSECKHLVAPNRKHDLPYIGKILEENTRNLFQRARDLCTSKLVDNDNIGSEVMECKTGTAVCSMAMKYNATAVVVGRQGDGSNKGSETVDKVKKYCLRYGFKAMIVEGPNEEQLQNKESETSETIKVEVVEVVKVCSDGKAQDADNISDKRSFPIDVCESPYMEVQKRRKLDDLAMIVESPNKEQLQNKEPETSEMIKVGFLNVCSKEKLQDADNISVKRSFPIDASESPYMEVESYDEDVGLQHAKNRGTSTMGDFYGKI